MDREQTGFKVLGTYAAGGMGLGTGKKQGGVGGERRHG